VHPGKCKTSAGALAGFLAGAGIRGPDATVVASSEIASFLCRG
jgi:hypothetical protein